MQRAQFCTEYNLSPSIRSSRHTVYPQCWQKNMKHCAEITINLKVNDYDPLVLLSEVLGKKFIEEHTKGDIWIENHETNDPIFPSFINIAWNEERLGLEHYAEIRLAQLLYEHRSLNSIVSHYGLIKGFDAEDPYYCLLLESGNWFFATTAGSLLEQFYTGSPGVKKIAEFSINKAISTQYLYDPEKGVLMSC